MCEVDGGGRGESRKVEDDYIPSCVNQGLVSVQEKHMKGFVENGIEWRSL